jgi:alpha-1,2-mannosyltransferase
MPAAGCGYRSRVASTDQGDAVTAAREPAGPAGAAGPAQSAGLRRPAPGPAWYRSADWLLTIGGVAFGVAVLGYITFVVSHPTSQWMEPVDLRVYTRGGLIVRHIAPYYKPHKAAPLYQWPVLSLQFTYPPFAAMVFTVLTLTSFWTLMKISVAANILAMLGTIWMTFGALGYRRGMARLGATLLLAAPLFWSEPVQRTLFLGQIEIVLMALIIWDQVQPDRRWWKGAGIGIAAGIKLIPLIFIPYLLLTRRFRQAAVAAGTFVLTIAAGFIVLPADSRKWWLDGLFYRGSRTGFVGWEGNQSLQGIITRLTGSVAGAQPIYLVVAAATLVAGVVAAALLDRAGHRMVGLLTCALTGLLCSPISWDHHWVWIVPGTVVAAVYAVRAGRPAARLACGGLAVVIVLLFGAWPGRLWGEPNDLTGFSKGLIWAPPNTNPSIYYRLGDRPWYAEYHWHGLQLITGNLYVLTGMAVFLMLLLLAIGPARAALAGRSAGRARQLTPAAAAPAPPPG